MTTTTQERPPKPAPKVREPREYEFPILSPREVEQLDAGPVGHSWQSPRAGYWQERITRRPQQIKDLALADAAEDLAKKFRRYGVSGADRRHLAKLRALLDSIEDGLFES